MSGLGIATVVLLVLISQANKEDPAPPSWVVDWRPSQLATVAAAGTPLVKAIEEYQEIWDEPPESLAELVPDYLPSIPDPGIGGGREFHYLRFDSGPEVLRHVYYQLSSRGVEDQTRDWRGTPALILCLGEGETVVGHSVRSRPHTTESRTFTTAEWTANVSHRYHMVASLLEEHGLDGLDREQLGALLGPPDLESDYQDSRWMLHVDLDVLLFGDEIWYRQSEGWVWHEN